ncbi:MAG TPA: alanine--tRNA ligase [Planctomycetes bacterium]|nr:alanine--tRNA ligase [Planctomycetota bacterium]
MRVAEIRSKFLEFFRENGHEVVPSGPVVPHEDPTLLFANAGMNQFKSVFTGEEKRDCPRAASAQKCIRAGGKHNDLENVGYTARHLTFFEMLGNFSFGDYFKKEACLLAWKLVTDDLGLDTERLWISVFEEDDEARDIWRDEVGVSADRIVGFGEKDNFWSMGDVGPCGPCSEIYFDRGEENACGPDCVLGVCDCDRWLEIWNLVFMQYEQQPDGSRKALPSPSIDTGMGLERITMILQGKDTVFETDLLAGIIDQVAVVTGAKQTSGVEGTPHRVIADHLRTLCFAIADGAFPSNEDRGYVLRRILRRASRYGYKLGMEKPFIYKLVPYLVGEMGDAYPELRSHQDLIVKLIQSEEKQFLSTLRTGITRFDDEVSKLEGEGSTFPADAAFFLHDSCGFPIDLTEQMGREVGIEVDRSGFEKLMDEQRTRSRAGSKSTEAVPVSKREFDRVASDLPPTVFEGYSALECEGELLALQVGSETGKLQVVLDRTPFYAESGGQVGDSGSIEGDGFRLAVDDCQRSGGGVFFHDVTVQEGDLESIRKGAGVHSVVDGIRRSEIIRNHTATHLLHAALRQVVGEHVLQKGSRVAPDRLRFDVSHYEKIDRQQLLEIEGIVQDWVLRDVEVLTHPDTPIAEAKAMGAMALFGEKYGDRVRVVEIPEFSLELCGGVHCQRTGEIGPFIIVSEGSVSSGVRRIEALTGTGSAERTRADEDLVHHLSQFLKVAREDVRDRIESLVEENRNLRSGKGRVEQTDYLAQLDGGHGERWTAGDAEVVTAAWESATVDDLLEVADALKRRAGVRAFILATSADDGVRFVIGTSGEVPRGVVHCGEVAKQGAGILGGGGGGKPEMAQAGGKEVEKLPEALEAMAKTLQESFSAVDQG